MSETRAQCFSVWLVFVVPPVGDTEEVTTRLDLK